MKVKTGIIKDFIGRKKPIFWINSSTIRNFARENNWSGNGTKPHPYIIKSLELKNSILVFYDLDKHVIIKDCNFNILTFYKCKNMVVKRTLIQLFNITFCYNIIIEENTIFKPYITGCRGLSIKNNRIPERERGNLTKERVLEFKIFLIFDLILMIFPVIYISWILYSLTLFIFSSHNNSFHFLDLTFCFGMIFFLFGLIYAFKIQFKQYHEYLKIRKLPLSEISNNTFTKSN